MIILITLINGKLDDKLNGACPFFDFVTTKKVTAKKREQTSWKPVQYYFFKKGQCVYQNSFIFLDDVHHFGCF